MRRLALLGVALVVALLSAESAAAGRGLRTGFLDPGNFAGQNSARSFARARAAGASIVRIPLVWSVVATAEPADAEDPADPAYQWDTLDKEVVQATQRGLDPLVFISGPPPWARGAAVGLPGTWPSPTAFGEIAHAAALRYSGNYKPSATAVSLPRVRFWQAWNEPNAGRELTPQRRNGRAVTPAHYRLLVNAFADAVHAVQRSNLVVAGGLAPFGHDSSDIQVVAPLQFMSQLLCVSQKPPYRRTCPNRTRFDVWSHNPYANGGPNRHAHSPNDISIGDLPKMHELLAAARKAGTIESRRPPEFWVTEISWDTNPPDPLGVPSTLHARWVAEALYRMWQDGVSAVIWFRLQDDPLRESPYQSGFYTAAGAVKPSLRAFRFPFVAFRTDATVQVWGRTPTSTNDWVIVEGQSGAKWTRLARVRADAGGIFSHRVSVPKGTALRAQVEGSSTVSVPFSLIVPPDRPATAFGCGGPIPC
jgi:hypothetical protein